MLVRDFVQPATVLGEHATVGDALDPLTRRTTVYLDLPDGWVAISPHAIVGYPVTRRLIDVPANPAARVPADADIKVVLDSAQAGDVMLVEDDGQVIGCVDRRKVLDVLTEGADPERLGLLLLTRFTPSLLHDLANSLTVASDALGATGRVPSERSMEAGRLALDQARSLLQRARALAAGHDETAPTPLSVAEVVDRFRPLLETALGRGISLEVEIAGEVPAARSYRQTIERCLLNLMINARDALGDAGRVRLSVGATDGEIELVVADDGPGVPPELADKLFVAGVSTRRGPARGLGLASVAQALHRVGGTIALVPSALGGAAFRIGLPRA